MRRRPATQNALGGAAQHAAQALVLILLATALASLAACGQSDAAPKTASATLIVMYWPHGQETPPMHTWTLRCDPDGGDHPSAVAACTEVASSPLALGRARHACRTRARPGSPVATLTGTFRGRPVDRLYRPGCDDWATLHIVLTGQ